jgi:large subunit ribosomal protein L32e
MKKLLKHRKELKSRKPVFLKQDTHKKPGIGKKWSRPRGIDSKMRLRLRGYRILVTKGWKSPSEVRGLHPTGLVQKLVYNEKDLRAADPKKDGVIIAAVVGMKKKVTLIRIAGEMGLAVLNVKDAQKFITEAESGLSDRKKKKAEKAAKKTEEKPKKAAKKEETKSVDDIAKEEEDRQDAEKREKDKVLTKRE